ncbi:Peptidyl-prolyl cis-trans isomerase [Gammaproteobacteria bacterium]
MNRSILIPLAFLLAFTIYSIATRPDQATPKIEASNVTELVKTDIKPGEGDLAISGKNVTVHYTGWLYDMNASNHYGYKFDSSRDRNQPFSFRLGAGKVIMGWDQGLVGMKVGGQRELIIPSDLGYGARGAGRAIPPNTALVFEIELLKVD